MRAIPALIVLLWVQLFMALMPTWRHGEYYAYGWFVPLLASGLAWRRWALLHPGSRPDHTGSHTGILAASMVLLAAAAVIPLRLIGMADPFWRPPLLLHVLIVCLLTHWLLWRSYGARISLGMMPVTIFALSCVPYPWQFERKLVHGLTAKVMDITREWFLLAGRPVELEGERLAMGGDVVEVTDGCSGIRSLQSLLMVALFFGELFFLSLPRRLVLVATAAIGAVIFNTFRAWWLATLHFDRGPGAAASAHDTIGHLTFCCGAMLLWLTACVLLRSCGGHRILRRTRVTAA